jgi:hypothetical protein
MKCPNCQYEINPAAELAKLGKGIPKPKSRLNAINGWETRKKRKELENPESACSVGQDRLNKISNGTYNGI